MHRADEVSGEPVARFHQLPPRALPTGQLDAFTQLSLLANKVGHALELGSDFHPAVDDVVHCVGDLARHSEQIVGHSDAEVTVVVGVKNRKQLFQLNFA